MTSLASMISVTMKPLHLHHHTPQSEMKITLDLTQIYKLMILTQISKQFYLTIKTLPLQAKKNCSKKRKTRNGSSLKNDEQINKEITKPETSCSDLSDENETHI